MKRLAWLSHTAVWLSALSLIWAALLAFDVVPELRGGFGWRWPYDPVLDPRRIAPFIAAVALYVPVALALQRRETPRALLLWALAGGVGLSLAAVHARDDVYYRLYTVTISGLTGGWQMASTKTTDLVATLRAWPQFMADSTVFSSHMGISPPGMVTIYYAAAAALARFPEAARVLAEPLRPLQCHELSVLRETDAQLASAWLGMLMPLWGALTVLPLYRLGRQAFGEEPARWSVLWWPLIPGFVMFAPLPNTLYPLAAVVMVLLLYEGLTRNQPARVFAAGLLMSVMTFVTFAFSPLLLLAGFLTLGMYWLKSVRAGSLAERPAWIWPVRMGVWYGLGLSVVWGIVYALSGLLPWDVLQEATRAHLALKRPYLPWVALHLYDFFMFAGWPLALLAGAGVWGALRSLRERKAPGERDVMILSAALALVVLDLSGTLRGETGRILLFLAPWLLLAAAGALGPGRRFAHASAITAVQALVAVVMVMNVRVLDTEFTRPPAAAPSPVVVRAADANVIANGAAFEGIARLKSFSGRVEMRADSGGQRHPVLLLWLDWEPIGRATVPYYLAVQPVAPDGEAAPSADLQQPFRLQYPTTCWKPGEDLHDQLEVPLFKAQSGDWWLSLRLVDGSTGAAVNVVNADGSRDTQVGLGPLR